MPAPGRCSGSRSSVGDVHIGALNLYRDRPGPLTDDQHADAVVMGVVAARSIISMQADAAPGALAPGLEATGNFRFVVHQAAGMIAVQLAVPVPEALLRLRARAFSTGRAHLRRRRGRGRPASPVRDERRGLTVDRRPQGDSFPYDR